MRLEPQDAMCHTGAYKVFGYDSRLLLVSGASCSWEVRCTRAVERVLVDIKLQPAYTTPKMTVALKVDTGDWAMADAEPIPAYGIQRAFLDLTVPVDATVILALDCRELASEFPVRLEFVDLYMIMPDEPELPASVRRFAWDL